MQKKNQLLKGIDTLSEQEKLEIFNVQELEKRLEMADSVGISPTNHPGQDIINTTPRNTDEACWWQ
ncbi:MAG: hypothetical protein ABI288_08580 [Ginsengibacter sp.]